jgi:hypothetical protein
MTEMDLSININIEINIIKENTKNTNTLFWGGGLSIICGYSLVARCIGN